MGEGSLTVSELMPKVKFPGRIMPTHDSELTGQADSLKSLVRSAKDETERNAITSALEKTHGTVRLQPGFCELAIELYSTRFSNTISPSDQRWQSSANQGRLIRPFPG